MVDVPSREEFNEHRAQLLALREADAALDRYEVARRRDLNAHIEEGPPPTLPPDAPGIPDPERGGFTLEWADDVPNAASIEDRDRIGALHSRRGPDGSRPHIRLSQQPSGRKFIDFDHPSWPEPNNTGGGGTRTETHYGIGYDQSMRVRRYVHYPADTMDPPGFQEWSTFLQTHSTSAANQHSPMLGLRNYDSRGYIFMREDERGKTFSIPSGGRYGSPEAEDDRVIIPHGVDLLEELTFKLRPDDGGFGLFNLYRLDTGTLVATRLYEGPTQIGREGTEYDVQDVLAYINAGVYRRATEQRVHYRQFGIELWTRR